MLDYTERKQQLQTIQPGEKVFYYHSRVLDPKVLAVHRTTATRIILLDGDKELRFNRRGERVDTDYGQDTYILGYDEEIEADLARRKAEKRLRFFIERYDFKHAPIEKLQQIAAIIGYEEK